MAVRLRRGNWRGTVAGFVLAAVSAIMSGAVLAANLTVSPGAGSLADAVAKARPGDTLILEPGIHAGPVVIDKSVIVEGRSGAVVQGSGRGSTIRVSAPDVILRGLTVTGSGSSLATMDSGVFVDKSGDRAQIEGNRIEGNLFGVYLWGPNDAIMRGNTVIGRRTRHVNQRGNGVSLWNTPGSIVEGNDFQYGRDGIFTTTSRRNIFSNNRFRNLRIAVHYMYTNDSRVSDNLSEGNHAGFALMFSRNLEVSGNRSLGDRDHGIMLNYANDSVIEDNQVKNGKTKCVFIYNSHKNVFRNNLFEGCPIGIHFTAGSERNRITSNAFIANRTQVKYVGTRDLDWSHGGRGNYWSDNPAFDLNGDGVADTAYRPNDMVDRVVWAHPTAKLLLNSPSMQVLRWAQSVFPALHPGGVIDSAPLMHPPQTGNAEKRNSPT
ncbi:MAG: nitrous oxide reductase family maturation protein NosD [Rhodospirillales bacterium]|nr:nitrous oxide reductase family maturation protein NosD [Rhodospirillales bacterium]